MERADGVDRDDDVPAADDLRRPRALVQDIGADLVGAPCRRDHRAEAVVVPRCRRRGPDLPGGDSSSPYWLGETIAAWQPSHRFARGSSSDASTLPTQRSTPSSPRNQSSTRKVTVCLARSVIEATRGWWTTTSICCRSSSRRASATWQCASRPSRPPLRMPGRPGPAFPTSFVVSQPVSMFVAFACSHCAERPCTGLERHWNGSAAAKRIPLAVGVLVTGRHPA